MAEEEDSDSGRLQEGQAGGRLGSREGFAQEPRANEVGDGAGGQHACGERCRDEEGDRGDREAAGAGKAARGQGQRPCADQSPYLEHLEVCERQQVDASLDGLARRYRPSKFGYGSSGKIHLQTNYQRLYPRWLEAYRHKKFKMLEIGLESGRGSLLWRQYFPCVELWGLDNAADTHLTRGAQAIHTVVGDQGNATFLKGEFLEATGGAFDLIVDDGGHHYEQQRTAYEVLFLHALRPNGLYIIEDVETSYWKPGEDLYGTAVTRGGQSEPYTIVNLFKSVVDVVNKKFFDNTYVVFGSVDHWIQQLTFASNVIFILKKGHADCESEADYLWARERLAFDCPARAQRGVPSAMQAFCKEDLDASLHGDNHPPVALTTNGWLRLSG